jgi:carbonic anhydrase
MIETRIGLALLLVLATGAFASGCTHAPVTEPKSADETSAVLDDLRDGNKRFVEGKLTHPHQEPADRAALAAAQKPKVVVLSCSDSRVPPEVVFDQGLGDLFTIRVAGNIAEPTGIASIEYAVAHFHPKILMVMGHDYCGAVTAAVKTPAGQSAGSSDLDHLVSAIQKNLAVEHIALNSKDPALHTEAMANVDAVSLELLERSAIIRQAVDQGQLKIVHAVYGLDTGNVSFW